MTMNIALDLEGVLAENHDIAVEYSDQLSSEDFEEWDFNDDLFDHFQTVTDDLWSKHWPKIPSVSPFVGKVTAVMNEYGAVDIVTNRHGRDSHVRAWLDYNQIEYDDLVSNPSGTDKSRLDYDVYVDDNPHMAGDVDMLFLRDRPWNQYVRGDGEYLYDSYEASYVDSEGQPSTIIGEGPRVIRVTKLDDVVYHFSRSRGDEQ